MRITKCNYFDDLSYCFRFCMLRQIRNHRLKVLLFHSRTLPNIRSIKIFTTFFQLLIHPNNLHSPTLRIRFCIFIKYSLTPWHSVKIVPLLSLVFTSYEILLLKAENPYAIICSCKVRYKVKTQKTRSK